MASATDKTAETAERGTRRTEVGIVLSDVRNKTITVGVEHRLKHPRYGKYLTRSTNYHAHDEKNEAKKGDRVEIVETRPISKQKRWRLVKVIERAAVMGSIELKDVDAGKPAAPSAPAAPAAEQK